MMKRLFILLLTLVFLIPLLAACASVNEESTQDRPQASLREEPLDYTYFEGKDIAVITGVLTYNTTERIGGNPVNYNDSSSAAEDVRQGRVAGYMHTLTAVQVMAAQLNGFEAIAVPKEIFSAQVAGISHDQSVIDSFDAFLSVMETDGTLAEMRDRWFGDLLDLDTPIPDIPNSGNNGVLRIATCSDSIPYVFAGANGNYSGFSVELALRFGAYEGKTVEFIDMEFGGLIPYIVSRRADIALANMAITEERKQSVLFTEPFFDEQHGILTLRRGGDFEQDNNTVVSYSDFAGKRIGVDTGSVSGQVTEDIGGTPVYYSEMSAAIEDLRRNRIDGYMTDESIARVFDSMPGNEDIMLIDVPAEVFAVQQGAISMSPEVIDRFNVFLAKIRADGTLNEMRGRWLETVPDLDAPMPNIPLTGENGTLQVVTSGVAMPFSFFGAENQLKGFCIEMAYRFAAHEGMDIEFSTVDFSGFIPYVISGRADIGIDALFITEERKQSVLFSEPYAEDRVAILTLRHSAEDRAAILTLRHSNDSGRNGDTVLDYRSFAGKRIGHKTGTIWDQIIEGPLNAVAEYYSDMSAGVEDIRMNRIDGFIADLSAVRVLVAMQENQDLINVEVPAEIFSAPMAAVSLNQDIIDRFNVFLASVEADGTLEDMQNRWLNTVPDLDSPMPEIISIGTNGTLLVATSAGSMPFAYMGAGNELKGYSIELVYRFAAHEGMVIEFSEMDFGAMIPYIVSGRADLAIADISITEERKLSVSFTDPIYYDQGGIIALRPSDTTVSDSGGGFISWLITGVERNLITDNRWEMIVNGLGTTMLIALMAQIFGTVFGCFVCYVLTRKSKLAQWFGNFYCGLIRGTPAVVLLMITYYIIFGGTRIPGVVVAIAAFTMVTGASIAQILKGAIETVDPVEIEAARSLGFPAFKAFLTVTLPQAVRRALPAYTNGFVELVKATAIVGFIAIQDLTRAGDIIRSRTYDAYFPLLFIAVIYLIVTMICVQLFKLIVKKVSGGVSG